MATELNDTETETPDEVLKRLERMVHRAGEFALGFVRCNSPLQCSQMSAALKESLSDLRFLEITLDEPIISLLDRIEEQWDTANPPNLVCVYGLEKSINPDRDYSPVLGRLNHDRDLIRKAIPVPLLIWLPDFALDCLVRGAPDFWAWRSGVYEFPTDLNAWYEDNHNVTWHSAQSISSLSEQAKRSELAHLEELSRSALSLARQDRRELDIQSSLLYQIGLLHESLGELSEAKRAYEQSLQINRQIGKAIGIASVLHQLGILEHKRGNLLEAQRFYEQSLHISLAHDYFDRASNTLHQMGMVQEEIGNFDNARKLYKQSLGIAEQVANMGGIADSVHQLAMLEYKHGNFDEARKLYDTNLRIYDELGDESGRAHTFHQLGRLQQSQGDLGQARHLYEQSLQIWQKLGDKLNAAVTLGQLGLLQWQEGKLHEALSSLTVAWKSFSESKFSYANQSQNCIQQLRQDIGEEQFRAWLMEDFGKEAKQILQALDEPHSAPR